MSGSYQGIAPTALSALTVGGVPTLGTGGLLPFTGRYIFVNESTGSDGNAGTANSPLATLAQAQAQATANQNDVVLFTGTIHQTSSLVWAKNQVHLIGLCDGIKRGKRARISVSGSTAFNYLVDCSASGCMFANFGTFYGFAVTSPYTPICWRDTGGRNMYDNVEILGFGDGTVSTGTAVQTTARALLMSGSTGETTFRHCVFGVDTIQRNATNYTVEIAGGAPRVTFEDCDFESDLGSSGTASSHVLIGADGIDRYCKFKSCTFMSATLSAGSAMAQVFNVNAAAGGVVLLDYCTSFGCTAWETSASNSVFMNMPAVSAPGGGKMLVI